MIPVPFRIKFTVMRKRRSNAAQPASRKLRSTRQRPSPSILLNMSLGVLLQVLEHCPIHTLLALRLVNRYFYNVSTCDHVWQKFNYFNISNIYQHMDLAIAELEEREKCLLHSATDLIRADTRRELFGSYPQNRRNPLPAPLTTFHQYTQLLVITSPLLFSHYFGQLEDFRIAKLAKGHGGVALYLSQQLLRDRDIALWVAKWDPTAASVLGHYLNEREFCDAVVQVRAELARLIPPHMVKPYMMKTLLKAGFGFVSVFTTDEFQDFKASYPEFASLEFVKSLINPGDWGWMDLLYPEYANNADLMMRVLRAHHQRHYVQVFLRFTPEVQENQDILAAVFEKETDISCEFRYGKFTGHENFIERMSELEYAIRICLIEPNLFPTADKLCKMDDKERLYDSVPFSRRYNRFKARTHRKPEPELPPRRERDKLCRNKVVNDNEWLFTSTIPPRTNPLFLQAHRFDPVTPHLHMI